MTRREKLENIIIGTLLESREERNYYDDCRSLSADMFQNDTNRRIFGYIMEMNAKGMSDTTPADIFKEYGAEVMDIVPSLSSLCIDYSFIHLKTEYNERNYIASLVYGTKQQRTEVRFEDYVTQFIKLVYDEETKRVGTGFPAHTAA